MSHNKQKTTDADIEFLVTELCSLPPRMRARTIPKLLALLAEARHEMLGRQPAKNPLPHLSDAQVTAIKARGASHPWSRRAQRISPVDWVRLHYSEFIPGLMQSHLMTADPALYAALQKVIQRKGLPSDLDIPSRQEALARMDQVPPKRRSQRELARMLMRRAAAAYRQLGE